MKQIDIYDDRREEDQSEGDIPPNKEKGAREDFNAFQELEQISGAQKCTDERTCSLWNGEVWNKMKEAV